MQTIHASLSFRTALVAQERIHSRRGTIRDSCNPLIAENVPAKTPSSRMRRIGTGWLWQRQSQISCKWLGVTPGGISDPNVWTAFTADLRPGGPKGHDFGSRKNEWKPQLPDRRNQSTAGGVPSAVLTTRVHAVSIVCADLR
jgi:hypothetical protein